MITLFDNGGGPPRAHDRSRGLTLTLDFKHMTATRAGEQQHTLPPADFEGNHQQLPNGNAFLGWGQQLHFAEFDSRGQLVLEGHFVSATAHYRAYRFPWAGSPSTRPAVSTSGSGSDTTVYASWNGATNVTSWRILGGDSAGALKALGTSNKQGFETPITIGARRYVAAQALDASGHSLATSIPVGAR